MTYQGKSEHEMDHLGVPLSEEIPIEKQIIQYVVALRGRAALLHTSS